MIYAGLDVLIYVETRLDLDSRTIVIKLTQGDGPTKYKAFTSVDEACEWYERNLENIPVQ